MNTLTQQKANVARLRDLLEKETDPLVKEFIQYQLGTARLWHDVAECGVLEPERIEQVKVRRRVKYVAIGIMIAIVLTILFLTGCNTVREGVYGAGRCIGAVGEDVQWIATKIGDNVNTQEK